MSQFDLYIDISTGDLVKNAASPDLATMPALVQGDTPTFRIWLMQRTSTYPLSNPFSFLATTGIGGLQVAIGTRIGSSSTYYTQQFTWTASTDPANPYWQGTLALNTAAITTLLGTAGSASAYFEVKYLSAGLPTTVFSRQVTITAAVIKDLGTPSVPAGQTPLSAETALATFLTREISGAVTLVAPGGRKFAFYVDDTGQPHFDEQST